jgi:hypothetical protein
VALVLQWLFVIVPVVVFVSLIADCCVLLFAGAFFPHRRSRLLMSVMASSACF